MSRGAKPRFSASDRPGKAFLPNGIYDYHLVILPDRISNVKKMVGHKKLSGKQEEIRFQVSLALCLHVSPKTGSLKNRLQAYAQVARELAPLGVSPRYVGDIWRCDCGLPKIQSYRGTET